MDQPKVNLISHVAGPLCGTLLASLGLSLPGLAQVVPDSTLGSEGSIVTPGVSTPAGIVDLVGGGALRDRNLFHSFLDFNVYSGQRLYFANPATVETIISRVTGHGISDIRGTLGVLGDASLFLINPNGIIFGPNSELDIRGSFVAATASDLAFEGGYVFSAVNPDIPPLLTINAPLGIDSWLPNTGTVTSLATNLEVGQDLVLAGQTLDIQGSLRAGNTLSLTATNDLTITDAPTQPTHLMSGDALLLQGNQSLQMSLLDHPDSGIEAGGDLRLRSDQPVLVDATFVAGGNVTIERLDGSLGSAISPTDPVFEVAGDFAIADFTGASLQILAGGSVTIPGAVTIVAGGGPFNDSTVILSNGTSLTLTGSVDPTLDVRAGTTGFFGTPDPGTPTSADITIGSIAVSAGQVFLTNQFAPNPALAGDITVGSIDTVGFFGGGDITVDSRGGISFEAIDSSGFFGPSGDVTLLATGEIRVPFLTPGPTSLTAVGSGGGQITLASDTAVVIEEGPFGTDPLTLPTIQTVNIGDQPGADIVIEAPTLFLGGNVLAIAAGTGSGGSVFLAGESITTSQATVSAFTVGDAPSGTVQVDANTLDLDFSFLGTVTQSTTGASAGNVTINTSTLSATQGAQISSQTFGTAAGDTGDVTVTATDILLSGSQPDAVAPPGTFVPSAILSLSQAGATGTVTVNTETLTLLEGAVIAASAFGVGDSGDVIVQASEAITIDGAVFSSLDDDSHPSGIVSEVFAGAIGNGGQVTVSTANLSVTNGGTISASTNGDGDAGDVTITATEQAIFDGVVSFASVGLEDRVSGASVETLDQATGSGGTLTVTASNLTVTNGARLEATTEGIGNAGDVVVNVEQDLTLADPGSGIFASTTVGSTGDGGDIVVTDPVVIAVRDGAQISVASDGTGTAGNILVEGHTLLLDNGLISAESLSDADGGNISLAIEDIVVLTNNSRISTTAGTALAGGDGGDINLVTTFLVGFPTDSNSDITANAFSGAGGNVFIDVDGIFGMVVLSRAELETLLGTSDPVELDPANLPSNDITAISRESPDLQGEVFITSPDLDPSQGVISLPTAVVDASRLIAQGCSSGGTVAQEIGSLVVTGRGGLPAAPGDALNSRQLLLDWASASPNPNTDVDIENTGVEPTEAEAIAPTPASQRPLQEVQSLAMDPDGQVVLLAQAVPETDASSWLPTLTCAGEVHEDL